MQLIQDNLYLLVVITLVALAGQLLLVEVAAVEQKALLELPILAAVVVVLHLRVLALLFMVVLVAQVL
jgi:hypothetical protein